MTVGEGDVWVPDVTIYNTVGITQEEIQPTLIGVYYDGTVYWSRPGPLTLKCGANGRKGDRPVDDQLAKDLGGRHWPSPMDLSLFPFDKQRCEVVMSSWFYPGRDVNLTMMGEDVYTLVFINRCTPSSSACPSNHLIIIIIM